MAPPTEVAWLEPLPGALLTDERADPEAVYSTAESVKLAFIAALQSLPARQRAVLLLRDVLAWSAAETADTLEMSVPAANSMLHRARQTMTEARASDGGAAAADPDDPAIRRLLEAYLVAWQRDDVDGLVATLKADVRLAMPPSASWFDGREAVVGFIRSFVMSQGAYTGEPTTANAQPAFEMTVTGPDGVVRRVGLQVLTIDAEGVSSIDFFLDPELYAAPPPAGTG